MSLFYAVGCILLSLAPLLNFFLEPSEAALPVVSPPYGRLSVKGTHLVGENGEPVQLVGVSLFWSQWMSQFYTENTIKHLACRWKANAVRVAMGVEMGGYLQDPTAQKELLYRVADAAIRQGMYVVLDWHTYDDYTKDAILFFHEVSKRYAGVPNVLYEDYNEPVHVNWPCSLTFYHQIIIKTIRANDPDAVLLAGTPMWDRDVDEAGNAPLQAPYNNNVCYVLHFYAASHGEWLLEKAKKALAKGVCLFVTEYGTVRDDGDGMPDPHVTDMWWRFLDQNKISYLNWAVGNKAEGASILKPNTTDLDLGTLSALSESGVMILKKVRGMDLGMPDCPGIRAIEFSDDKNDTLTVSVGTENA